MSSQCLHYKTSCLKEGKKPEKSIHTRPSPTDEIPCAVFLYFVRFCLALWHFQSSFSLHMIPTISESLDKFCLNDYLDEKPFLGLKLFIIYRLRCCTEVSLRRS
ncbi:hypothetical protein HS088_TW09G00892 [Tripterygium wilfordii]|uniref:Uncharacterized protein n=1 Tax=Tripterygium wilfordii TaxID=458696 RepID=A0A7J7D947_TRIWF|nr:hypothetical protein HS088_TW09G00892 [Tripterygium wilfordii]